MNERAQAKISSALAREFTARPCALTYREAVWTKPPLRSQIQTGFMHPRVHRLIIIITKLIATQLLAS